MSALLEIEGLNVRFASGQSTIQVTSDVSLDVGSGEVVGIVGESGSGKTVTMKAVLDLLPPSASVDGSIKFDGREVTSFSEAQKRILRRQDIAMVFQNPMTSLNPVRKIGTQVTEGLRLHGGLSKKQASSTAISLLERVRLPNAEKYVDAYPHELSGGMRQRVVIAMALANEPKLLIADEPTTALDVTVQKEILDLLDQLRTDLGMSMVLISHDLGVIADRADRVVVMYGGAVMETARPIDLFSTPRHPYTIGLKNSMPDISMDKGDRIEVIEGNPPGPVAERVGCAFVDRCGRSVVECGELTPPFIDEGDGGHTLLCHNPVPVAAPSQGVN